MTKHTGLHKLRDLSWLEVFSNWREAEISSPSWRALYTARGFDTWESWRMTYAHGLSLPSLLWELYEVPHPLTFIPTCVGGPFQGWHDRYYGTLQKPTFAELATVPALQQHVKIRECQKNFPKHTTLIAVELTGDIVIIEGMHRCVAIALAAAESQPLKTDLQIALAHHPSPTLPIQR